MSLPFSLEQLARIRDDIRRLAAGAADHQHELEAVVRAAEADVSPAEAARSHALARLRCTSWSDCWPATVKRVKTTRDARVIVYTANPSLADVMVQRLFAAVFTKPSMPDILLAAVQNVARG